MDKFNLRLNHIQLFYKKLNQQEKEVGGKRLLNTAHGRMKWPRRGVYFFFEPVETRSTSGEGLRIVRVGTHALIRHGKQKLWDRLRTHRGTVGGKRPGGGNHRGSVFRLHVGTALIARDKWKGAASDNWGYCQNAPKEIRSAEYPLEKAVSRYIRKMPFLWIEIDDEPGPDSLRGCIERNAIRLLSNYNYQDNPIDRPDPSWLGNWAKREAIRRSGLWNGNHVKQCYDPRFLDFL